MTPPAPAQHDPVLSRYLRRKGALLALLRRDDYRRDAMALLMMNLRGIFGLPFLGGVLLLFGAGAWLTIHYANNAAAGYEILQVLAAIAAIGMGSGIYAADQQSGAFELLWLATGSEKALLRMKMITLMIALLLLTLPSAWVTSRYLDGLLPLAPVVGSLMVNAFLLLSMMALLGAVFPQAWASGVVGLSFAAAVYLTFRGSTSAVFPFHNLYMQGAKPMIGLINRGLMIALAALLLQAAQGRLKKAL